MDAPAASRYRVSVELALESGSPGAYAGIFFAARGPDDLYAAYVLDDRAVIEQGLSPAEIADFQRTRGVYPKVLRVARVAAGRWTPRGQSVVAFPDEG